MWRCKCKCKWWGNCLKPYQKWSKRFKAPSCLFLIFRRCIMLHYAHNAFAAMSPKSPKLSNYEGQANLLPFWRAGARFKWKSRSQWTNVECKWMQMKTDGKWWNWWNNLSMTGSRCSVCLQNEMCMCVCVCLCHEVCHVCHVIHVYRKSSLTLQQVRHPSPTAEETTLAEASNVHRYPGHTAASNVSQKASCRPFTEQLQCKECTVLSSTYCNGIEDRHPSQFLAKIGGRWEEPSVEFPNFALASPPKKAPSQWCSSTRKVEIDMT